MRIVALIDDREVIERSLGHPGRGEKGVFSFPQYFLNILQYSAIF